MSATQQDEAIILRRSRFSETSLLLVCLTRTQGKIKVMARGALRPHSPFGASLDLWHRTRLVWTPARRGEVHTLREAEMVEPFTPAEPAHSGLLAAAYFSTLAEAVMAPGEPHLEIFQLLQRALAYLCRQSPDRRAVSHYERELARLLGIFHPGAASAEELLREYIGQLPASREELWALLSATSSPPLHPARRPAEPPPGVGT